LTSSHFFGCRVRMNIAVDRLVFQVSIRALE
jgi:hypothetical protein